MGYVLHKGDVNAARDILNEGVQSIALTFLSSRPHSQLYERAEIDLLLPRRKEIVDYLPSSH
eukprot:1612524-Heterocapsa_arctica.AAC.1